MPTRRPALPVSGIQLVANGIQTATLARKALTVDVALSTVHEDLERSADWIRQGQR